MSKAIVMIDIPTDYADEYKQWIIDGSLCYLEDGAWTFLKEVEYKVESYREVIPVEWIENWKRGKSSIEQVVADKIMMDYKYRDYWEKENEK